MVQIRRETSFPSEFFVRKMRFPTYLPVYPIHKRTVCVCVCLCMRVVLCVGPWVWTPLNKETILFGVLLDLLRVPYTMTMLTVPLLRTSVTLDCVYDRVRTSLRYRSLDFATYQACIRSLSF